MENVIPEAKHKKIIAGASYFYSKKPSEVIGSFTEFEKLMKFCKYILENGQLPLDPTPRQLSDEEQIKILTNMDGLPKGVLPNQIPLLEVNN